MRTHRSRSLLALSTALAIIAMSACAAPTPWTALSVPDPGLPGDTTLSPQGLSCGTPTQCLAVEARSAAWWDGRHWTPVAVPWAANPGSSRNVRVSCSGPDHCIVTASEANSGVTAMWRFAANSFEPLAAPPGLGVLRLACPSTTTCVAQGEGPPTPDGSYPQRAVFVWDGASWADITSDAGVADPDRTPTALACATPTSCLITGTRNGVGVFSERWDGRTWVDLPVPGDRAPNELSCATTGLCVGVVAQPLNSTRVWVYRDGGWSISDATPWGGRGVVGVSCTPTSCFVAAYPSYPDTSVTPRTLFRFDGSAWSAFDVTGPWPGVFGTQLSCATDRFCAMYGASGNSDAPLAVTWDGTAWTTGDPLPPPSAPPLSHLFDVSCTSETFCIAVGASFADDGPHSLTMGWDGTTWSIHAPSDNSLLRDVSCASPTFCVAVAVVDDDSMTSGLRMWDGATWSRTTSLGPATSLGLFAVDCPTETWCLAAGTTNVVWDGVSWTRANDNGYMLPLEVECTAPERCVSPGSSFYGSFEEPPRVWDAEEGEWAPGAGTAAIRSVSCGYDGTCIGVEPTTSPAGSRAVTHVGDGTTWTAAPDGSIPGVEIMDLSCVNGADCVAAGRRDGDPDSRPLTFTWDGKRWTTGPRMTVPVLPATQSGAFGVAMQHWSSGLSCVTSWCMRVGGTAASTPLVSFPGPSGRPLAETARR